jgi:hypothetical protein
MNFEHSPRKHLEESLSIELNIAELLEWNVPRIQLGEALDGYQPTLISGLVTMNADDLSVAQVFLLLAHKY